MEIFADYTYDKWLIPGIYKVIQRLKNKQGSKWAKDIRTNYKWQIDSWKYSEGHQPTEKHKWKTTIRFTSFQLHWLLFKNQKITNAGEDVGGNAS